MPSPPHPCAHPGCTTLVQRKHARHCKKHVPKTPEWNAKNAAAQKGRKLSPEVRQKLSVARGGKASYSCESCGKMFYSKPHRRAQGDGRFCSSSCSYADRVGSNHASWRADMPSATCRVCGKTFRLRAVTLKGKRLTCSYQCKNIWQKTHQKTKATDIERLMATALTARGWSYQFQVGLCNICTADFYVPHLNAVIFCDGDYWHSLPDHIERDQRQTAILTRAGYRVFRFKGSEIHADVNACLSIVQPLAL